MGKVDRRFGTKLLEDCIVLVAKQFYEALMSVFLSFCLSVFLCVSIFLGILHTMIQRESREVKRVKKSKQEPRRVKKN